VVVACLALGRPWLLALLAALGACGAFWLRGGLIASALAGHNGSGEVRTLLWLAAWHMIRDHPVLGIGLDQFLYYYSNLYTTHPYWITVLNGHRTLAWREPTLAHPHNLALDLWLSTGLLGLAGFAIVLGTLWWRCLRLWRHAARQRRRGWAQAIALGVAGSTLAGVLHGMVDSAYFEPDLALIFWWSVAVLLLAERSVRHGGVAASIPPPSIPPPAHPAGW
jgi:putative inorganic carbon (HCO3(-)) transporter